MQVEVITSCMLCNVTETKCATTKIYCLYLISYVDFKAHKKCTWHIIISNEIHDIWLMFNLKFHVYKAALTMEKVITIKSDVLKVPLIIKLKYKLSGGRWTTTTANSSRVRSFQFSDFNLILFDSFQIAGREGGGSKRPKWMENLVVCLMDICFLWPFI